jgi:hypothetical protein
VYICGIDQHKIAAADQLLALYIVISSAFTGINLIDY